MGVHMYVAWLHQSMIEWVYLNRETDTNKKCKITRGKQEKTIELVHNGA